MAITTVAGAIADLMPSVTCCKVGSGTLIAGSPASLFAVGGYPLAGALQAGLNGAIYNNTQAGLIPRTDPASGNAYLARFLAQSGSTVCKALICDRIWDNTVPASTLGAQSIVTPTWPSRDINAATAGAGLHMGLEVHVATSAAAAAWTVGYTDSAGVSGLTASQVDLTTAAAAGIGRFYRMSDDPTSAARGIQSIQNINFATTDWTAGTFGLVVYRVVASLDFQLALVVNLLDAVTGCFPQLYPGSSMFVILETNTTASPPFGFVWQEAQG